MVQQKVEKKSTQAVSLQYSFFLFFRLCYFGYMYFLSQSTFLCKIEEAFMTSAVEPINHGHQVRDAT